MGHVSPMILVTIRWLVVAGALYAVARRQIAADWATLRSPLGYLLFMGALGFTLFSVALYYALVYTTAINASILQGGMPFFVFCASFLLFKSRVVKEQVIGFLLSFVGVIIIAAQGQIGHLVALNINAGDALMIVAIIAYGVYTAMLRSKPQVHWTSLMFILCLGATLTSVPLLAVEAVQGATILPRWQGWLIILYIVVFPTLLSQLFFIRAVELIGPNRAGLFINLLPLWGALLAVTLLGEDFRAYHGWALAMIFLGIGLAEYGGRRMSSRV